LQFVSQLRRGGLALRLPRDATPNLSVILGGAGVTLESLTGAYTAFARGGIAGRPRLYRDQALHESRMMSEGAAFIVRAILESGSPVDRSVNTATGVARRIALKTGTSFGFRDAWAVGVTDRYTVGVWVGRPDGTPNPGHFGANVAAPLLIDVFSALTDDANAMPRVVPPSVSQAQICWPLGVRYSPQAPHECHVRRTAWILNDAAPPTFPDKLRAAEPRYTFHVSKPDELRVAPDCAAGATTRIDTARWPALLEPWVDASLRAQAIAPAWSARCRSHAGAESALEIVGAADGEILHRAGAGMPLVRLHVRGQSGHANWMVNGALVARTGPGESYAHRFETPGRHEVTAFDDHGRYDRIGLSVR